ENTKMMFGMARRIQKCQCTFWSNFQCIPFIFNDHPLFGNRNNRIEQIGKIITVYSTCAGNQFIRGSQMPFSPWMYYNLSIWTIPEKQARSAGMIKMDMSDDNVCHLIQRKTEFLQALFDMFDRWARACFNECQIPFGNDICSRPFRKP